jgi:hypothetical protein
MSTSAAADTRATAAARAAAAPRAPPPPPPPRAGLQSLSPDLARLLAGHLRGEEGSLAATCRLFRDAARSTRGPAGSVVARLDADLQAVSGVLARVPGVTSLTLTLRLDPGRAANLHFLAAARVTALDLRREGGAPPARALALLARGFPALRELSVEAPPGRARRSAPPPLAALRELGALTALTLLNVHEDAGLEAVTTLRRLTLELTDHGDVALERCPACGEAHETEEVEFSERVRAWEAAPPTRVGAALCSLPLLEELLVDFGGGGGVAGAAAARNCLVGFGAAGGGAPGWAALREIQLRDLGDGDSVSSAASLSCQSKQKTS